MPELPEVETITKQLCKEIIGKRIMNVRIFDKMVIRHPSQKEFIARLKGKVIDNIFRRGKAIIFKLNSEDFFVLQLVMTGQLIYKKQLSTSKVTFSLSNNVDLNYNDQRRFGRLNVVYDLNELEFLKFLGIEPLSPKFDYRWLEDKLAKRTTLIKPLLMDQKFIAGIGNIYASEILFHSKINPRRSAGTLNCKEIKSLCLTIKKVLKEAISLGGITVNTYCDIYGGEGRFKSRVHVYGRENEKCIKCESEIQKIVQAGRSTFFCKRCQS